jgi:hypothetical protein
VCPVDYLPLNSEKDLFPDNFTRREIQQLDIKNPQVSKDCHMREMFLTLSSTYFFKIYSRSTELCSTCTFDPSFVTCGRCFCYNVYIYAE